MKKDLGSVLALYPTPLVVVGTMVNGKPNWVLVGHVGIMGHDHIMVSLAKPHYTNQGIRESKALSVNIVDEEMLQKADYVGCVSGSKTDKSQVFEYTIGQNGAPQISEAKLTMECSVEDIYETKGFDNFILTIDHTYAEESILNDAGKINYDVFKPILFEMPGYTYLKTGETAAKCMTLGRENKEKTQVSAKRETETRRSLPNERRSQNEKNSFPCIDTRNGIYPCRLWKQRLHGEQFS